MVNCLYKQAIALRPVASFVLYYIHAVIHIGSKDASSFFSISVWIAESRKFLGTSGYTADELASDLYKPEDSTG